MHPDETKQNMHKVLEVLKNDIATVRTGRANASLVDHIVVCVYSGTARMKILELATVTVPDSQTIVITPFDKSVLEEIQKGIAEANIGFNPGNDGQLIRISIPPLSEERRQQLIHLMKQKLENGKIMVRQVRQETMHSIKKQFAEKTISEDDMKRLEKEAQKTTDDTISEIDALGKRKEEELLQI